MKRFFVRSIVLILSVLICFYGSVVAMLTLPFGKVYDDHYQKGYIYQYRALERAEGRKIITVGGSNVSFNVDTQTMAEITGIPSYNLGVIGGMGYRYMTKQALKFVGEGDIVVFPLWQFRLSDQDMELLWITLEGEPDLVWELIRDDPVEAVKTIGSFGLKKAYAGLIGNKIEKVLLSQNKTSKRGYFAGAFDQTTGNYIYERTGPIASGETMRSMSNTYSTDWFTGENVTFLRTFVDRCRERGAEVYFTFSSVYRGSITNTDEELNDYDSFVRSVFSDVTFLNTSSEVMYEHEYYYNAPTHLSSKGMERYTEQLAMSLVSVLNF